MALFFLTNLLQHSHILRKSNMHCFLSLLIQSFTNFNLQSRQVVEGLSLIIVFSVDHQPTKFDLSVIKEWAECREN